MNTSNIRPIRLIRPTSLFLLSLCVLCAFARTAPGITLSSGPSSNVTRIAAVPYAQLTATNGTTNAVNLYCYYGTSDGTNNAAQWTSSNLVSSVTSTPSCTVTSTLTSLTPAQWYYYRWYAVEGTNNAWATATSNFWTTAGAPTSAPPAVAHYPPMLDTNHNLSIGNTNVMARCAASVAIGIGDENGVDGKIYSEGTGSVAYGFASATSIIRSSSKGSRAGGEAYVAANIWATNSGAIAEGSAIGGGLAGAYIYATNNGSRASGCAEQNGWLLAGGKGSLAEGWVSAGAISSYIRALGLGARASGFVLNSNATDSSYIEAAGDGSFAGGYILTSGWFDPVELILASGTASWAHGRNVRAEGPYSFAAGRNMRVTGTNSWGWSDGTPQTNSASSNFWLYASGGFDLLGGALRITGVSNLGAYVTNLTALLIIETNRATQAEAVRLAYVSPPQSNTAPGSAYQVSWTNDPGGTNWFYYYDPNGLGIGTNAWIRIQGTNIW